MDLLLDTHTLIWFLNGDSKLSLQAKSAIENPENSKFVSIATAWEIAIKISLGKFKFDKGLKHFLGLIEKNGFEILPISFQHVLLVSGLEFLHRDPFDRLLIAQCKEDNLSIVTKDDSIKLYNVEVIW